ncbi:MAG: hypothetical protein U0L88_05555, partial [Acutalibacteraceae bacterium]|nr:hypothetical protein [Acutalibacteraceae bacterium]
ILRFLYFSLLFIFFDNPYASNNPSDFATLSHLPLHRGGFGGCGVATHNFYMWEALVGAKLRLLHKGGFGGCKVAS